MYLTFEQALKQIKSDKPKDPNYAQTRISCLIREGKLVEAFPDFYLNQNGEFVNIGKLPNVRLVNEASIVEYLRLKEEKLKLNASVNGKPLKGSKPTILHFSNGDKMEFRSRSLACDFLGITRSRADRSIKFGRYITVKIHESRKGLLFFETGDCELKHETVKFTNK